MGNDSQPTDDAPRVDDFLDSHADPALAVPVAAMGGRGGVAAEAVRPWRAAESLKALRRAIDARWPARSKASDGIIGDAAHQSRASDHNPWITDGDFGVVSAMDITHDPASGCDAHKIVAALVASRDDRIKYVIWNRRICSATVSPWNWRAYSGRNGHTHHFHLSVKDDKAHYDGTSTWQIEQIAEAAAGAATTDIDRNIVEAVTVLAAALDSAAPTLPQLVELEAQLRQLQVNYAREWELADPGVAAEAAPEFAVRKPKYEALFTSAKVKNEHKGTVAWYVKKLREGRTRYEEVQAAIGVPWWFVGIVHAMEASFSFNGHLHNGDPLSARTVQVPSAHPVQWNPPSDWKSSAIDALTLKAYDNQTDWTLARCLDRFERYNGFGYYTKGIPSPYLWSFTNHYEKGKFIADRRYDPNAVSKQCGSVAMLRALVDLGDVVLPN
jgi:lysozyme family protein